MDEFCHADSVTTRELHEQSKEVVRLRARVEELEGALREIAEHPATSYEGHDGQYGIGVTDGHRLCAEIARRALTDERSE